MGKIRFSPATEDLIVSMIDWVKASRSARALEPSDDSQPEGADLLFQETYARLKDALKREEQAREQYYRAYSSWAEARGARP